MDKKIENACRIEDLLNEYKSKEQVFKRLKYLGFDLESVESFQSIVIEDGLINSGCFVHDLKTCQLFEKVCINKASFEREFNLFKEVPSDALVAPKYFGCYKDKIIFSVYYEAVDIRLIPSKMHLRSNMLQLAIKLWMNEIYLSPMVKNKAISCEFERLMKKDNIIKSLSGIFVNKGISGDVLKEMAKLADRSNNVIFHGDYHSGNVLYDGKRYYVVDWDKWSVSKVGVGFLMKYRDFKKINFFRQFMYTCSLDINKRIINNFILYNVMVWMDKEKIAEVNAYVHFIKEHWIDKLSMTN